MLLKFRHLLIIFSLLVILLTSGIALLQEDPFPRDADAESLVLTELNRWRMHRGLGPLMRNTDLDVLALDQAMYISPNVPFTGDVDFHTDAWGDGVAERAEYFGWPGYDQPDRVFVSEIAAYYPDVAGAINFWQNSPPHRSAVQTAGFREAGVAVLRNGNWLISYVVLGGRPDVLPVMYDPSRNMLYLSLDRSYYAEAFTPLYVQILDLYGNRLHDEEWLVWSERMRLPAGADGTITVIVTDGIREIVTQTNLAQARVFPSEPMPQPPATPTLLPTPTALMMTPTPLPPTFAPTVTPAPVNSVYEIMTVYDGTSFSLINESGIMLDLSRLVIQSDILDFTRTAQWLGRYSEVSLSDFPSGWCMQVWSFEVFTGPPNLPDGCHTLASGRSLVSAGERFWLASHFTILYDREVVADCRRNDHLCAFDLPTQ